MPRTLLTGFLLRSAVLWVLVRLALAALLVLPVGGLDAALGEAPARADPFPAGGVMALAVIALVAGLVLIDLRAMRERIFLANLGLGRRAVAVVACLSAGALEAGLALLRAA